MSEPALNVTERHGHVGPSRHDTGTERYIATTTGGWQWVLNGIG